MYRHRIETVSTTYRSRIGKSTCHKSLRYSTWRIGYVSMPYRCRIVSVTYPIRAYPKKPTYRCNIGCGVHSEKSLCFLVVCNPSISVFKGHGLPREAEEYLVSHGLKNASYTICANDVKDDLFGILAACPYQQPDSSIVESAVNDSAPNRFQEMAGSTSFPTSQTQRRHFKSDDHIETLSVSYSGPDSSTVESAVKDYSPPKRLQDMVGTTSFPTSHRKHFKSDNPIETLAVPSSGHSCILEFDGASKGNPGQSGAGAVLRAEDGSAVYRLREGVGIATNNVAEYRAVILGLKYALEKGYKHIRVKGDSKLVCMQIQGLWKTKNENMAELCQVARELKEKFMSFDINHVLRDYNSDADVQANRAINLQDGQVEVDWNGK